MALKKAPQNPQLTLVSKAEVKQTQLRSAELLIKRIRRIINCTDDVPDDQEGREKYLRQLGNDLLVAGTALQLPMMTRDLLAEISLAASQTTAHLSRVWRKFET